MVTRFLAAVVFTVAMAVAAPSPVAAQDKDKGKLSPAEFLLKEGKRLRDAKDFPAALQYFEAAATLDPENVRPLVHAAWTANEMGDHKKALLHATAATRLDPEDSDAWTELGYAQLKMKQVVRAVRSLQRAIEKDDKNWSAYDYLILAYREDGDEDEAKAIEAQKQKKMGGAKGKE